MQWQVVAPARLDAFLAKAEPEVSRARIQKLIDEGKVSVNGKKIRKQAHKVQVDDVVEADLAEKKLRKSAITPKDLKLTILYEDDDCLVINKPAGFAVHPAPAEKDALTILNGVAHIFKKQALPFSEDAVLVHRLDKDTTGCLLIAKNPEAHAKLQKQFETRTVKKTYLAIVQGVPSPSEAMIDAPVGRNLTDRTKMSVLRTSVSREAKTSYKILDATKEAALLACDLHTGRTHQIRVHLSSINHPILGDETYFSGKSTALSEHEKIESICLHSWKLSFESPNGKKVSAEASLPKHFAESLNKLSLRLK